MPGPKASRPQMPGYGIADAGKGSGLLPWRWARERLNRAERIGPQPPVRISGRLQQTATRWTFD